MPLLLNDQMCRAQMKAGTSTSENTNASAIVNAQVLPAHWVAR